MSNAAPNAAIKAPPRIFAEGNFLIEEGGRQGSLFILESGAVEVMRGGMVVATIAEPGAVIGEMSVLLNRAHSASVRAKTTVIAHVVDNAATALQQHPELIYKVAQILARRLAATTTFLVESRERPAATSYLDFLEEVYSILDHPA